MFSDLFKVIGYGYVFHKSMEHFYPQEYSNVCISLFESMISIYSHVEIYLNHLYEMNLFVKDFFKQFQKNSDHIKYIHRNCEVLSLPLENYMKQDRQILRNIDYDFIIYSFSSDVGVKHKIMFEEKDIFTNCVVCNFQFISIELNLYCLVNNTTNKYLLKLNADNGNYYLSGNKINHDIICYLLCQQFNMNYNKENSKYTLNIIDHNIKNIQITEKDVIILGDEGYTIEYGIPQHKFD